MMNFNAMVMEMLMENRAKQVDREAEQRRIFGDHVHFPMADSTGRSRVRRLVSSLRAGGAEH